MIVSADVQSNDVRRLLRQSPAAAGRAAGGAINDISALYLRELKTYPDRRSGSSYVRTRTLARSWNRQLGGSGLSQWALVGSNGNMAPYNRRVQDETRQARMHRQTWREKTVQAVERNTRRQTSTFLQRRVNAEFGRLTR